LRGKSCEITSAAIRHLGCTDSHLHRRIKPVNNKTKFADPVITRGFFMGAKNKNSTATRLALFAKANS